jgi:hypothetical protein
MTNATRTFLRAAALALAALSLPAAAGAQARRAPATSASSLVGRWELGVGVGPAIPFESGIDTGVKLNFDAFYGLQQLSPAVTLQLGGNFAWTHNGAAGTSVDAFDFLPQLRLHAAVAPEVFAYADVGMGLAAVHGGGSGDVALLLKLGGGLGYLVSPRLALTFEPAFNIYARSGSLTEFTMLFGVLYRP